MTSFISVVFYPYFHSNYYYLSSLKTKDRDTKRMLTSHTLFDTVGNTPLLRLTAIGKELEGVELYAKAEYFNPTGSVKDRAAKAMIMDGIARGALTHDKTIIDATSGNTGIAYAALGAALGYKVALCLPANATEERKKLMKLYGA